MDTRVEVVEATNGATLELATIIHEGKEFTARGSIIDKAGGYLVGYVSCDGLEFHTWSGEKICRLQHVSSWRVQSPFTDRMHAYRAVLDGKRYYGRGCGPTMVLRMRASKGKRR